ncbi:MAG: WbqC family protein [Flavobacteriales bacterium]|nr:WbqC family protein [Flavobacteriales bacterium]
MKKIAILQSNYIPWKGYFDMIDQVDVFVIYDEVQYTKNDWRNRNIIKTPKGTEWLTIAVRQESLSQRICDTKVTLSNWNVKHLRSLQTNYGKAPFFKQYFEEISEAYLSITSPYLSEINVSLIKKMNTILGIGTTIIDSRELALEGGKTERLVDAVLKLGGNCYLSGPAGQAYIDVALFNDKGIEVEWMDYSNYAEYPQLHPPFVHGVSILDLLFNAGAEGFRNRHDAPSERVKLL